LWQNDSTHDLQVSGVDLNGATIQDLGGVDADFSGASNADLALSVNPNRLVLFAGLDANNLNGLWVTDGTGAGTTELDVSGAATSGQGFFAGLSPVGLTVFGNEVLFGGVDASGNSGLWVTDGTGPGTTELNASGASPSGLFPFGFAVLGNSAASHV
jgi:hypothetical protein